MKKQKLVKMEAAEEKQKAQKQHEKEVASLKAEVKRLEEALAKNQVNS